MVYLPVSVIRMTEHYSTLYAIAIINLFSRLDPPKFYLSAFTEHNPIGIYSFLPVQ